MFLVYTDRIFVLMEYIFFSFFLHNNTYLFHVEMKKGKASPGFFGFIGFK